MYPLLCPKWMLLNFFCFFTINHSLLLKCMCDVVQRICTVTHHLDGIIEAGDSHYSGESSAQSRTLLEKLWVEQSCLRLCSGAPWLLGGVPDIDSMQGLPWPEPLDWLVVFLTSSPIHRDRAPGSKLLTNMWNLIYKCAFWSPHVSGFFSPCSRVYSLTGTFFLPFLSFFFFFSKISPQ